MAHNASLDVEESARLAAVKAQTSGIRFAGTLDSRAQRQRRAIQIVEVEEAAVAEHMLRYMRQVLGAAEHLEADGTLAFEGRSPLLDSSKLQVEGPWHNVAQSHFGWMSGM